MRFLARTLMFLAFLMYGTMPGMATMSMSVPTGGKHLSHMQQADAGKHDARGASSVAVEQHSDPCPHSKSMTHAPFCAACLVLLPELTFAEKGLAPHAAPMPDAQSAFIGTLPAPPLPPPRV